MLFHMFNVVLTLILLTHRSFSGVESPFLRVAGLHKLLMLAVKTYKLFGQGTTDVDFQTVGILRSVYAFSKMCLFLLLLGLYSLEDPSLVHSMGGRTKNNLILMQFGSISEIQSSFFINRQYKPSASQSRYTLRVDVLDSKFLRRISFSIIIRLKYSIQTKIVIIMIPYSKNTSFYLLNLELLSFNW